MPLCSPSWAPRVPLLRTSGRGARERGRTRPGRLPGSRLSGIRNEWPQGRKIVVSAGGTREPLDPVRYLGNRSSGKQGVAIARAAAARGANGDPRGGQRLPPRSRRRGVVPVETTLELQEAVVAAAADADVVVMAAAPADFRPATASDSKIKKARGRRGPAPRARREPRHRQRAGRRPRRARGGASAHRQLRRGDRRRRGLGARPRAGQVRPQGQRPPGANEVGDDQTFGQDETTVHLLRRGSDEVRTVGPASKDDVADALLGHCRLPAPQRRLNSPPPARHTVRKPKCPHACSRPSPSPRDTRTRSATRSATRSSMRCSPRTPGAGRRRDDGHDRARPRRR